MRNITAAEKRKIVAGLLKTPEGRASLAAALQEPLRTFRDYEAVGRRAFMVDPLGDGQLPYYDKDPKLTAYVVGEEGEDLMDVVKGDRIFVPLFEIAGNPQIPLTQVKMRKYDVEARVKQSAKNEIFRVEDQKIFKMFTTIANDANHVHSPVTATAADATIDDFSEAMALVEKQNGLRCANIFMNPGNMKIVRRLGKDYFEPSTTAELLRTGRMGNIFGATVNVSPEIAADEIYFTSEEDTFGVFVQSQELTVMPADRPEERKLGWSVFQQIGVSIHNPYGLSMLKLT